MTTPRTRFGNRTAEIDSTRVVWRGDAHGGIHVHSLQVRGGVAINVGVPSIPLADAQRRWPEHRNLWAAVRHTVETNNQRHT
ncbi:hypothetical protein [Nocardia sp. N2S4-5]|uniref:hypothetical protein n=1 Tax=Nocardia sp. N2S4-5 TaxID=3351565 RepID=UPI0037D1905C